MSGSIGEIIGIAAPIVGRFFGGPIGGIIGGFIGAALANRVNGQNPNPGLVGQTSIPDTGQLQTATGEDAWVAKQYGNRRAGMVLIANTIADLNGGIYTESDEGEYSFNVYVLGEGPMHSINQLYYYDNAIFAPTATVDFGTEYEEGNAIFGDDIGNIAIQFQQGAVGQTRATMLDNVQRADGSDWFSTTAVGNGICYMVVRLRRDRDALITDPSPTTFTFDSLGKEIPEIRLDNSPRQYSDATYTTGTNPAMIALDQIRDINYGAGISDINIDFDSFVNFANYCDDEGFELNGQFGLGDTLEQILQEISVCTGAVFTDENGLVSVKIMAKETGTTTVGITEDNVVGNVSRISPNTVNLPNAIRGKYISADGLEVFTIVEMDSATVSSERRKEIEIDLRMVNTATQANEILKRQLLSLRQPTFQFEMNNAGYDLELYGVANISDFLDQNLSAQGSKVRIEGFTKQRIQENPNNAPVRVVARLYTDEVFDQVPNAISPLLNISEAPGINNIPTPTNVNVTQASQGGGTATFRNYSFFNTEISFRNEERWTRCNI